MIAAMRAQNVQAPVGRIGARPVSDDQQFQFNVQTLGRLATPEQFADIVVRANPDGSVLRVKDVARVEIGAQNHGQRSRIDGRASVAIGIYLAPGANAITRSQAVAATMAGYRARFPTGLSYLVQYNSTSFVGTHPEVLRTLGEAFVLVVLVVYLFLGNLRATVIPAIAVPVSLVGTFAVLLMLGYSANTVSLLAMVLAIGIVVDDAIVVVENVERVVEEESHGTFAGDATKKAMEQITAPYHRDHVGTDLRLCSVSVHPGISGVAISAICRHYQRRRDDFGTECADTCRPPFARCFCAISGPRRGMIGHVSWRH